MVRKRCEICDKLARYKEFSPDGAPYYFCSEEHHSEFVKQEHEKGLFWRASPLTKIEENDNMFSILAVEKAGQAWTTPETSSIVMDVRLAKAFADILDDVLSQPWLGNATTDELLTEIRTRLEMENLLSYRTVDSDEVRKEKREWKTARIENKKGARISTAPDSTPRNGGFP